MMEARSLAALNQLASNPPQYPLNPAQTQQEPLVLYISRVPGTRDVILSPFKPQVKSVTSEDVATSFYYVHLQMPNSDPPSPAAFRDDAVRSSSDENTSTRAIPRKPLPVNARPMTPDATPTREHLSVANELSRPRGLSAGAAIRPPRPGPPPQWPDQDSGLGLTLNDLPPEPKSRPMSEYRPSLASRPHGPRPMSSHSRTPPPMPPGWDKELPPTPLQIGGNDGILAPQPLRPAMKGRPMTRSPSPRKFSDPKYSNPFSLTLIRRDPSTGNQWNVGRISSYQTETSQYDEAEGSSTSAGRPPINIQIDTLGYAKFRHMPAKRSLDANASPREIKSAIANMSLKDPSQARNEVVTFSRQVFMGYSKSWASNMREKWHQRDQARGGHGRHASVGSVNSVGSTGSSDDGQEIVTHSGPGLKPRGYIFTSPWDGRCEFRTGNAGRSVRCYHILHDDGTSSFNPLVSGPGSSNSGQGAGAMPISELRFNLPSTELLKTPQGRREAKEKIQGHFNKFFKGDGRRDDSDEDDGTVSPFSMNLGREKAGGGNSGKRAKLGKLIIYPDGLKMLDLVVAANIGLWWGAWEKSF